MSETAYSRDVPFADPAAETAQLPRPTGAPRPALDPARLWTGGVATAVGAAALHRAPEDARGGYFDGHADRRAPERTRSGVRDATGVAHLLLVSTPRPLAYLGWIVGLATAAATVLPLASGLPIAAAAVEGLVNLVIGLAIGSLVTRAAYSASRGTAAS